jgi:hypothetical protein
MTKKNRGFPSCGKLSPIYRQTTTELASNVIITAARYLIARIACLE